MKIELFEVEGVFNEASVTWVKIDHGNGEFTSMPKATYEEQQAQAALSTPIATE